MKRFNLMRPAIILLSAYLGFNLTKFVSLMAGVQPEAAENFAYMGMIAAAFFAFIRMNRQRK